MDHELNHFKGKMRNLRNTNDKGADEKLSFNSGKSETIKTRRRNIQVNPKEKDAPVIQTTEQMASEKLMKRED